MKLEPDDEIQALLLLSSLPDSLDDQRHNVI